MCLIRRLSYIWVSRLLLRLLGVVVPLLEFPLSGMIWSMQLCRYLHWEGCFRVLSISGVSVISLSLLLFTILLVMGLYPFFIVIFLEQIYKLTIVFLASFSNCCNCGLFWAALFLFLIGLLASLLHVLNFSMLGVIIIFL